MAKEVRAAGGVVWRPGPGGDPEVAVVHRPKYDDWSLPKGKLDAGESWEAAALREVWEEIGLRCALGEEVGEVTYTDPRGRPKRVRYWLMAAGEGDFEPNDEVDELRWVPGSAVGDALSYAHDVELVARALTRLAA